MGKISSLVDKITEILARSQLEITFENWKLAVWGLAAMGNSCSGDKQRASYLDTIDNERERNVVAAKSLHEGSIRDLSFINAHGSRPNCLISCSDDGTMLSSSVSDLLASVEATQCKFTGHKKGINKVSVFVIALRLSGMSNSRYDVCLFLFVSPL